MHGLQTRPLLAAAALIGALAAGCQTEYTEETTTSELRANCLARYTETKDEPVKAELQKLMDTRKIEAIECKDHGDQLDAIRLVDAMMEEDAPATSGLVFEEVQ